MSDTTIKLHYDPTECAGTVTLRVHDREYEWAFAVSRLSELTDLAESLHCFSKPIMLVRSVSDVNATE